MPLNSPQFWTPFASVIRQSLVESPIQLRWCKGAEDVPIKDVVRLRRVVYVWGRDFVGLVSAPMGFG